MKYGNKPIEIASDVIIDNSEMYLYQYLPIKMANNGNIRMPDRLQKLYPVVRPCIDNFIEQFGVESFNEHYIYVSAKCMFVLKEGNLNRLGWHSDGFMSDDINFIWCDSLPTEYITGVFLVTQDHKKSIVEFSDYAKMSKIKTCEVNSIYRLDQSVIHRCAVNDSEPMLRHFVKVSFSKDKYNLKGNSHNYLLDYKWEMKERSAERNHPVK